MNIDINSIVSMTDANQNFTKVAKVAERLGEAVIFKNNKPKFILIDIDNNPYFEMSEDEKIGVVAARFLNR